MSVVNRGKKNIIAFPIRAVIYITLVLKNVKYFLSSVEPRLNEGPRDLAGFSVAFYLPESEVKRADFLLELQRRERWGTNF